jgi:uncharacterized protein (DUF2126 family)
LSTAISMKPQEPRYFTASSNAIVSVLGQRVAVHLAGQAVEARQVGKPLLVVVTLGDDAHDAVCARRAAVGPANQRPLSSIQSRTVPPVRC